MDRPSLRFEVKFVFWTSCLLVLAMWTYQGSTGNLFVWDSKHYLVNYESHFSNLNWENIEWMATSLNDDNWHPLTWFSWAVDYQLDGWLNPWGYHFSNNLLHAVKINPNNIYSLDKLGITYYNMGDFENAAIQFETSGKQTSIAISMLAWRGLTYLNLGRNQASIADYVNLGVASETRPESGIDSDCIQYNIGWNYAQFDMFQEALELFERVDPKSYLGPDAGRWTSALKKVKRENNNGILELDLPEFFKRAIPSRMHGRRDGEMSPVLDKDVKEEKL